MADLEDKAPRPLIVVCGTLTTKDTTAFLRAFTGLAQEVLAVPVEGEHAGRPPRDVAACAQAAGLPAAACAERGAGAGLSQGAQLAGAAAHPRRRQPLSCRHRARGERHAAALTRKTRREDRDGLDSTRTLTAAQIASEIQRFNSPFGAAPTFCEATLPSL